MERTQPPAAPHGDAPQDEAPPWLEIRRDERLNQRCLQSLRSFGTGDVIVPFRATATYERPARMTLQVSEHEHIELTPTVLSFVNHGCAPNVYFDVEQRALIALEPISAGDTLTFFYPSTEWTMASPFDCACGSPHCLGRVAGASQLPEHALQGHRLAPHITELLRQAARKR